jgi:hypothetical protein
VQRSDYGPYGHAFNEGVADYVLFTTMERRVGTPGGNWTDGYDVTAYFLRWIERKHPDFVYRLNKSAVGRRWTPDIFRAVTGKPVDALWEEYLAEASPATMTQPESLLKWWRTKAPDNQRRRACELTAYWDDDFKGDSFRTTQDQLHLAGGWNDQISSIVIASGEWEFFEHDEFGGRVLKLDPGRYPRLVDRGWNDQISSFRCLDGRLAQYGWPVFGCQLAAYSDPDFGGEVLRSTHDLPKLNGIWNDQISSIVVASGTWEFFEHDAFGGQMQRLKPGLYARLDKWDDKISSLRCVEPRPPLHPAR